MELLSSSTSTDSQLLVLLAIRRKIFFQTVEDVLERFGKPPEPQDVIRDATESIFDKNNLLESLDHPNVLFGRTGFNEKAKF